MTKSKTTTTKKSTIVATPTLPGHYEDAYKRYTGNVTELLDGDASQYVTGPSGLQLRAFDLAGKLPNQDPALDEAESLFRQASNYVPTHVNAGSSAVPLAQSVGAYRPDQVSADRVQSVFAGQVGAYRPDQVSAGTVGREQIDAFFNPYTDTVIDASLADLERSRRGAVAQGQAAATAAGAYGGSRHGIADAETNRNFFDSAGRTAASLRDQGFNTALAAAQNEQARRLQADLANQGVNQQSAEAALARGQQVNLFNAGNEFQANQVNVENALRALLANQVVNQQSAEAALARDQQLGIFNTGNLYQAGQSDLARDFDAQRINAQANAEAADFRRTSGANLAELGNLRRNNDRADLGLLGDLGAQERQIAQQIAEAPLTYQQKLGGLLALTNPELFRGQTQTENSKQTETSSGGLLNAISQGIGLAGSIFGAVGGAGLFGGAAGAAGGGASVPSVSTSFSNFKFNPQSTLR